MARWIARIAATPFTLVVSLASLTNAQQVWVVGPPGPGVFSQDIQPAVNAAADGDVILVKNGGGTANSWSITGKSLSLVGDGGPTTWLAPGLITGLAATQRVIVRDLQIVLRLEITNNAGPVWIEDCSIFTTFFLTQGPNPIVRVSGCNSVTLQRCTVTGFQVDPPSSPAFLSAASNIYIFDSTIRGATGPDFTSLFPSMKGAAGARIEGGFMFASGTQFLGGMGGTYFCCSDPTSPGQPGGEGLIVVGASANLLGCSLSGGQGSSGPGGVGANGAPWTGTPPVFLGGTPRHFDMSSPVREQQLTTATVKGLQGEGVAMIVSLASSPGAYIAGFKGALLVDVAGADAIHLGTLSPLGTLAVSFTAPNLPPAVMGANVYLQAVHFDPSTMELTVGPASALLVVDSTL